MHFEFNEEMLYFIATEMYNANFGTFIGNNIKEKLELEVKSRTQSMWTYIFLERKSFTNKDYQDPSNTFNDKAAKVLKEIPSTSALGLQEWRKFFYKWCEFGHQVY